MPSYAPVEGFDAAAWPTREEQAALGVETPQDVARFLASMPDRMTGDRGAVVEARGRLGGVDKRRYDALRAAGQAFIGGRYERAERFARETPGPPPAPEPSILRELGEAAVGSREPGASIAPEQSLLRGPLIAGAKYAFPPGAGVPAPAEVPPGPAVPRPPVDPNVELARALGGQPPSEPPNPAIQQVLSELLTPEQVGVGGPALPGQVARNVLRTAPRLAVGLASLPFELLSAPGETAAGLAEMAVPGGPAYMAQRRAGLAAPPGEEIGAAERLEAAVQALGEDPLQPLLAGLALRAAARGGAGLVRDVRAVGPELGEAGARGAQAAASEMGGPARMGFPERGGPMERAGYPPPPGGMRDVEVRSVRPVEETGVRQLMSPAERPLLGRGPLITPPPPLVPPRPGAPPSEYVGPMPPPARGLTPPAPRALQPAAGPEVPPPKVATPVSRGLAPGGKRKRTLRPSPGPVPAAPPVPGAAAPPSPPVVPPTAPAVAARGEAIWPAAAPEAAPPAVARPAPAAPPVAEAPAAPAVEVPSTPRPAEAMDALRADRAQAFEHLVRVRKAEPKEPKYARRSPVRSAKERRDWTQRYEQWAKEHDPIAARVRALDDKIEVAERIALVDGPQGSPAMRGYAERVWLPERRGESVPDEVVRVARAALVPEVRGAAMAEAAKAGLTDPADVARVVDVAAIWRGSHGMSPETAARNAAERIVSDIATERHAAALAEQRQGIEAAETRRVEERKAQRAVEDERKRLSQVEVIADPADPLFALSEGDRARIMDLAQLDDPGVLGRVRAMPDATLKRLTAAGAVDPTAPTAEGVLTPKGAALIESARKYAGRPTEFPPAVEKSPARRRPRYTDADAAEPTGRVAAVTARFASVDVGRSNLTGTHFDKDGLTATDGHRLLHVPTKVTRRGIFDVLGRPVEGTFPDWKYVVPKTADLKPVGTFSPQDIINAGSGPKIGADLRTVVIEVPGGDAPVWLNAKYVRDAGQAMRDLGVERVEVLVDAADSPVVIREAGGRGVLAVVMPVRADRTAGSSFTRLRSGAPPPSAHAKGARRKGGKMGPETGAVLTPSFGRGGPVERTVQAARDIQREPAQHIERLWPTLTGEAVAEKGGDLAAALKAAGYEDPRGLDFTPAPAKATIPGVRTLDTPDYLIPDIAQTAEIASRRFDARLPDYLRRYADARAKFGKDKTAWDAIRAEMQNPGTSKDPAIRKAAADMQAVNDELFNEVNVHREAWGLPQITPRKGYDPRTGSLATRLFSYRLLTDRLRELGLSHGQIQAIAQHIETQFEAGSGIDWGAVTDIARKGHGRNFDTSRIEAAVRAAERGEMVPGELRQVVGRPPAPFAKERQGAPFDLDIFKAQDKHVAQMIRYIEDGGAAEAIRPAFNKMRADAARSGARYDEFRAEYAEKFIKRRFGKNDPMWASLDRVINYALSTSGRPERVHGVAEAATGMLTGAAITGLLRYSPRYFLQNMAQTIQNTVPAAGLVRTARGVARTLPRVLSPEAHRTAVESGMLDAYLPYETGAELAPTRTPATGHALNKATNATYISEFILRSIANDAFLRKAAEAGASPEAAARAGITGSDWTQYKYGKGHSTPYYPGLLATLAKQFGSYPIKSAEFLSDLARRDVKTWTESDKAAARRMYETLRESGTLRAALAATAIVYGGRAAGRELEDLAAYGWLRFGKNFTQAVRDGSFGEVVRAAADFMGPGADVMKDLVMASDVGREGVQAGRRMEQQGLLRSTLPPAEVPTTSAGERVAAGAMVGAGQAGQALLEGKGLKGAAVAGVAGAAAGGAMGAKTPPWALPGGGPLSKAVKASREAEQGMELGAGGKALRPLPRGREAAEAGARFLAPGKGTAGMYKEQRTIARETAESEAVIGKFADRYAAVLVDLDAAKRSGDAERVRRNSAELKRLEGEAATLPRNPKAAIEAAYRRLTQPAGERILRQAPRDVRAKALQRQRAAP